METGKYIKKIREELNLSQGEMGERSGKARTRINEWENNKHSPKLSEFLEVCKNLKFKDFNKIFDDLF